MAENTIDNLSIQVVASAERAISTFNRLASGASGLRGAVRGAAGGMQDMAQGARDAGSATQQAGTQSGKARPNIKGVGKDAKDAGENAKKGSSGLATFWQSLKRIAYYRMIRSIIKSIGQAFREGAQNLYQWSAANPSLSDFAKNMNRISTSVTYLKNSLGAMLEPIVRILTPVIEWVIDKLVWLIDKVNQFFAALSGAETYTAAKKVAQTWGDTSQQVANNTHKAAEEIKRTILGFDEINKLDKPNSGSYGGGSGLPSASAAAQDMFEERPLEGWAKTISDFIRKIKDFFDGIFGPIKQLFTDAGDAFDDLNRNLDAAQQEEKDIIINIKTNPSDPSKIFDEIANGWDSLKSKTLFVTIRPATLTEYLFKLISDSWDKLEGKTLFVNIMLSQKAAYLWETLENAWDSLQGKTLFSNVQLSQKAIYLWETLKSAWDSIPNKVLYANVALSQKATYLWNTLKNAWDGIQNKVLYTKVMLSQKANYLWTTLSSAWDGIQGKVLYVNVEFSQKANYLWTTLSNAWGGIKNKVLYANVMLSQKANYLWTTLQNAWNNIQNKVVYANISLSQSANYLWITKKNAWNNIKDRVLYANVSLSQSANYLWTTLKSAWKGIQNKVVYLNVSLSQSANYLWTTLKNAWNNIKDKVLYSNVSLSQSASYLWTTKKNAWNNIKDRVLYANIKLSQSANYLWTTLKSAWGNIKDKVLYVEVLLKKKDWTTVTDFVDDSFGGATGRTYGVNTKLNKPTKETLTDWWNATTAYWGKLLQAGSVVGMMVALKEPGKDGMQTLAAKIGEAWDALLKANKLTYGVIIKPVANKSGQILSNMGSKIGSWLFGSDKTPHAEIALDVKPGSSFGNPGDPFWGDPLSGFYLQPIDMPIEPVPTWSEGLGGISGALGISDETVDITANAVKGWKDSYKKEVGANDTTSTITANLSKAWGKQKPLEYLGLSDLTAVIKTKLQKEKNNTVSYKINAGGGTGKGVVAYELKRRGGVFSNGQWSDIPQYANGTMNAGSLFVAGEAGPELVGHVGGRTEVLNKSQLASAMYSAVQAAMAPAAANFAAAAQSIGVADVSYDLETLAEMVRQGVEQAMGRQNELDRQRNEYLRQINEKDYNPEISTSSINKAQQRMNRRAGTTIVPVGT